MIQTHFLTKPTQFMQARFLVFGFFLFFFNCANEPESKKHIPKSTTQLFSSDLLCEHLDSTRYAVNLILNESKIKIDECNNCQLITNNNYLEYNIPPEARRGFIAQTKSYYFLGKKKDVAIYRAEMPIAPDTIFEYKIIASANDGEFKLGE